MGLKGDRQQNATYYYRIHRRLIKPPYPILLFCANCGHGLIEVNSDQVEIANSFGLPSNELKVADVWHRIKHSCGASITIYWV